MLVLAGFEHVKIFESFSILFHSSLLSVRATNNEIILLVYVVRSSAAVSQTEPEEEEHKKELAVNFEVEIPRPATSRTKPPQLLVREATKNSFQSVFSKNNSCC